MYLNLFCTVFKSKVKVLNKPSELKDLSEVASNLRKHYSSLNDLA